MRGHDVGLDHKPRSTPWSPPSSVPQKAALHQWRSRVDCSKRMRTCITPELLAEGSQGAFDGREAVPRVEIRFKQAHSVKTEWACKLKKGGRARARPPLFSRNFYFEFKDSLDCVLWGSYGPIWAHMGAYGLICAPYGFIWGHMGPYGPIWDPYGPICLPCIHA